MVVPHFDPDNPSIAERVEERLHPWIAALLLPIFVFLHTLVPLSLPTGAPTYLIGVSAGAILVGKTIGIGGTLFIARKRLGIFPTEALAVGLASAAALTVALIGVAATLKGTEYEQVVSLGILGATTTAVVLGIIAGRLRRESSR